HLHTWASTPIDAQISAFGSFQTNLPAAAHRRKLRELADAFETAFGFRASAHRAGRYGLRARDYGALADIGVAFDFSPSPGFDQSRQGGPDFLTADNAPFVIAPDGTDAIFVTPVSGARAVNRTRYVLSQTRAAAAAPGRKRVLRAATAPLRLTCEGRDLADLQALTRRVLKDGTPVLTFSLHSTTLTAGANPYAPDEAGVARALDVTRRYLAYFTQTLRGEIISLNTLARLYGAPAPRDEAVKPALSARA
ncbi:MAG: hypothetical protein AAGC56_10025, partial [Pseudomonadota bacterium]